MALSDQLSSAKKTDDKSRNVRVDYSFGSIQSDIIFDEMNSLPKEVTLKTMLNVYDKSYDILEVNIQQVL